MGNVNQSYHAAVGQLWAEEPGGTHYTALPSWLLITGAREVSEAAFELFGGRPTPSPSPPAAHAQWLGCDEVQIVVEDSASVIHRMVRRKGEELLHVCDGSRLVEPSCQAGSPCGCSVTLQDRMVARHSMAGPHPETVICFRLALAQDLGTLSMTSTSWTFADSLRAVSSCIDLLRAPARLRLGLERTSVTTRSGVEIGFTRPKIRIVDTFPRSSGVALAA